MAGAIVAILDDSPEDLFITRRLLKKVDPDCEIVEFLYADAALKFLRSPRRMEFDLILVDINMPRMNGLEFVDAYTGLYPELRGHARVVIMSHSIDPRDRQWAESNPNVFAYFSKPMSPDDLRAVLMA